MNQHIWGWKIIDALLYLEFTYGCAEGQGETLIQCLRDLCFTVPNIKTRDTLADLDRMMDKEDHQGHTLLTRIVERIDEDQKKMEDPDLETTIELPDGTEMEVGVVVSSFLSVPPWRGNPHNCPSDADYYGYTEIEWHLINDRRKPIEKIEASLDQAQLARIEDEIKQRRADYV